VLTALASALRLASVVLCLVVVASFTLFVVDQTGSASAQQQALLSNETRTTPAGASPHGSQSSRDAKGSVRKTIDEISEAITSPFSFATDATSSEWLAHGIDLALALLVYGFALGFVARAIRVRL
jgi:predicted PurR-regulated permease PerM